MQHISFLKSEKDLLISKSFYSTLSLHHGTCSKSHPLVRAQNLKFIQASTLGTNSVASPIASNRQSRHKTTPKSLSSVQSTRITTQHTNMENIKSKFWNSRIVYSSMIGSAGSMMEYWVVWTYVSDVAWQCLRYTTCKQIAHAWGFVYWYVYKRECVWSASVAEDGVFLLSKSYQWYRHACETCHSWLTLMECLPIIGHRIHWVKCNWKYPSIFSGYSAEIQWRFEW